MLVVSADSDHTVPWAMANASYKKQKRNQGVTEIVNMPGRGHALTIDAGWREVAEKALEFVKRFTARRNGRSRETAAGLVPAARFLMTGGHTRAKEGAGGRSAR